METKGDIIIPTLINDLLESYLMKIIEEYSPYEEGYGNLKFIEFTSIFFAKKLLKKSSIDQFKYLDYYKLEEDKKSYYYQHINLSITEDGFTDFLSHMRSYGVVTSVLTANSSIKKLRLTLSTNDNFIGFLLKKIVGEDATPDQLFYTFNFNIVENKSSVNNSHSKFHSTLINCVVTEFIPELGFCTSIETNNDCPYLILNNVIMQNKNDPDLIEFDSKIASDIDLTIDLLSSGINMKMFKYSNNSCFYNKLDDKEEDTCSICLDNIEHKQEIFITSCNHIFHFDCVRSFMKHYYQNLFTDITVFDSKGLITEHDLSGNIIKGGSYQYSCPNCKSLCFLLNCKKIKRIVKILNPENCIYKIAS